MQQRESISALPKGTALSRFIRSLVVGKGTSSNALHFAEGQSWRDTPEVELTLRAIVEAMDSASGLSRYGIATEYIALERGASIVGQLMPRMRRCPFTLAVPRE